MNCASWRSSKAVPRRAPCALSDVLGVNAGGGRLHPSRREGALGFVALAIVAAGRRLRVRHLSQHRLRHRQPAGAGRPYPRRPGDHDRRPGDRKRRLHRLSPRHADYRSADDWARPVDPSQCRPSPDAILQPAPPVAGLCRRPARGRDVIDNPPPERPRRSPRRPGVGPQDSCQPAWRPYAKASPRGRAEHLGNVSP